MASESQAGQHEKQGGWLQRLLVCRHGKFGKTICASVFLAAVMVVGSIFVVIMDTTDYVFSTMAFCSTTCHVMEDNVYAELKESTHWNTSTGVRAKCADCHVSRRLSFAMIDHVLGMKELFVMLTHSGLDEPGEFEKLRPASADRVRLAMIKNDSASCRGCHDMEAIKPKRIRGQNQHEDALKNGTTCIICHYNLVHKEVEPSPAFNKAIEQAMGVTIEEELESSVGEEDDEVL